MNDNNTPATPAHIFALVNRRRNPLRFSAPEIIGPTPSYLYSPDYKVRVRSLVTTPAPARQLPAPLTPEQSQRVKAILAHPTFLGQPNVERCLSLMGEEKAHAMLRDFLHSLLPIDAILGSDSDLPQRVDRFIQHIPDTSLATWSGHEPPYLDVIEFRFGLAIRAQIMWARGRRPACDLEVPEVAAICRGPEGIRAFITNGGRFSTAPVDNLGMTSAHFAASQSSTMPETAAAFIRAGGNFHTQPDNRGFSPSLILVLVAEPEAIRAFARAGGYFDHTPDQYGNTPANITNGRGPEFEAAYHETRANEPTRIAELEARSNG